MDHQIDKIKIHYNPYRQAAEVFILGHTNELHPRLTTIPPIESVAIEERDRGKEIAPAFRISDRNLNPVLQELFNDLWSMGFRPTGGRRTEPDAAVQAHLDDMRKLVFDVAVPKLLGASSDSSNAGPH